MVSDLGADEGIQYYLLCHLILMIVDCISDTGALRQRRTGVCIFGRTPNRGQKICPEKGKVR